MFFKKKEKVEFEATKEFKFANGVLQYDEGRNLIQYKNFPIKEIFSPEDIESYELQYCNKTYNKANLGKALVGGALFGVAGIIFSLPFAIVLVTTYKFFKINQGKTLLITRIPIQVFWFMKT